ncbi:MAG: hypothetical protein ACP5PP_08835 [Fervidobacterium sp.]
MYNISAISNSKLTSTKVSDKTFKVYIKYKDGTWKDISSYVKEINIYEQLEYSNASLSNKAGIVLVNTDGVFSPAKVGTPFNEVVKTGGNRTFLNTKFPIRIEVTANSTTYTLFRGYVNRVIDKGLEAEMEAYDILFLLSRKRYTKQLNVVRKTVNDVVSELLNDGGFLTKWQTDFGTAVTVSYLPDTMNDDIILVSDAKTYLDALNNIFERVAGFVNYRAIDNTLYVVSLSDKNYTSPSASITLSTDQINKFDIEQEPDVVNKVIAKTKTYQVETTPNDEYWKFQPESISEAILLPKGSSGKCNIDFGRPGYNPDLTNVAFAITTYVKTVSDGNLVIQQGAGDVFAGTVDLSVLPVTIKSNDGNDMLKITSVTVGLSGFELEYQNLHPTYNIAIRFAKVKVYPLLESGELTQIYEVSDIPNDEPRTEQEIESAYYNISDTNNPMKRQAEAYLTYKAPQYTVNLSLLGFYPHLSVGGVVNVTLQDTNFNNTKCYISEARHSVKKDSATTELTVVPITALSTTVASTVPTASVISTPTPSLAPTPSLPTSPTYEISGQTVVITFPELPGIPSGKYLVKVVIKDEQ